MQHYLNAYAIVTTSSDFAGLHVAAVTFAGIVAAIATAFI